MATWPMIQLPQIGDFPLTLNVAFTTVLHTKVLHCDCDNRARKMFHGYIPEMTSFAGRMNEKMGFKATASSMRGSNYTADNPFTCNVFFILNYTEVVVSG